MKSLLFLPSFAQADPDYSDFLHSFATSESSRLDLSVDSLVGSFFDCDVLERATPPASPTELPEKVEESSIRSTQSLYPVQQKTRTTIASSSEVRVKKSKRKKPKKSRGPRPKYAKWKNHDRFLAVSLVANYGGAAITEKIASLEFYKPLAHYSVGSIKGQYYDMRKRHRNCKHVMICRIPGQRKICELLK